MIKAVIFFVVLMAISGFFAFSGIATASAGIAKLLFFICLIVIFVILTLGINQ